MGRFLLIGLLCVVVAWAGIGLYRQSQGIDNPFFIAGSGDDADTGASTPGGSPASAPTDSAQSEEKSASAESAPNGPDAGGSGPKASEESKEEDTPSTPATVERSAPAPMTKAEAAARRARDKASKMADTAAKRAVEVGDAAEKALDDVKRAADDAKQALEKTARDEATSGTASAQDSSSVGEAKAGAEDAAADLQRKAEESTKAATELMARQKNQVAAASPTTASPPPGTRSSGAAQPDRVGDAPLKVPDTKLAPDTVKNAADAAAGAMASRHDSDAPAGPTPSAGTPRTGSTENRTAPSAIDQGSTGSSRELADADARVPRPDADTPNSIPAPATTETPPQTAARPATTDAPGASIPPPGSIAAPGIKPSFDVLNVTPDGRAVIAGRAAPGAKVTVRDGDRVLGQVTADRRGEWVLVPDDPLSPGDRAIELESETPGGDIRESDSVVVVSVPDNKSVAEGDAREPLAVQVPRGNQGGSVAVLQAPDQSGPDTTTGTPGSVPGLRIAEVSPSGDVKTKAVEGDSGRRTATPDTTGRNTGATTAATAEPKRPPESGTSATQPNVSASSTPTALSTATAPPRTPSTAGNQVASTPPGFQAPASQAPASGTTGNALTALTLDIVDYDAEGRVTIGGAGPRGGLVRVYLDNRFLAAGRAGGNDRWQVRPDRVVPYGLRTLRADLIGPRGNVLARTVSPFSRARPLRELPANTYVIVQPGNSLWRLARRTYGKGLRYTVIFDANKGQILDPDLIYPGQVFALPSGGN